MLLICFQDLLNLFSANYGQVEKLQTNSCLNFWDEELSIFTFKLMSSALMLLSPDCLQSEFLE